MKNDSIVFRQRKLTSSSRPNHQPQFDLSARFNTSSSLMNPLNQTATQSQLKKIILSLQKSLQQEKQKHMEAQDKLLRYMKRADHREKEFHNILASKSSSVYVQNGGQTNVQKLYDQVMGKVDESEEKMRERFELRYQENMKVMDRKIKSIIEMMETHLKKAASLSEQQHGQLKNNINRLQAVALEIDIENSHLIKLNADLEFKIKLLREEKNLLIHELNQKKQMCKKYFEKVKLNSRENSRAQSEASDREKSQSRSKNSSFTNKKELVKKDRKKVFEDMKGTGSFAIELIKSKMLSNDNGDLPVNKINICASNMLPAKKQYISSMTIGSANPQSYMNNQQNSLEATGRIVKPSPYLLKKTTNSFNSTLVNSTIKPSSPLTPHNRESSTIFSLKNIIAREKQKKLEYQQKLAEIQQKIIAIDKIIVEGLIFAKEKQEEQQSFLMSNLVFRKTSQKTIEEEGSGKGVSEKDSETTKVLKGICDRIKNIINGNIEQNVIRLRSEQILEATLNPVTLQSRDKNLTNQELLELLKVE